MGFFKKMGNAFVRLMYGRNGMDQLNLALLWAGLGADLLSMIFIRRVPSAGTALYYAAMALWLILLFRTFSRNLCKRQAENAKWTALTRGLRDRRSGARSRRADRDHRYFTCKNCRSVCRVPVGKGKIEITCPKCGAKIRAKT
ncbi:MAG: hypothetical protein LKJ80_00085 [Oscillibacter sp.]|jgi:hypothetical protein|nr:hypothetical protein [Oscillibacter sp.]